MRLYEHGHKIVGDKRRLETFFEEKFKNSGNNGCKKNYTSDGRLSRKQYSCDFQEGEIKETCTANNNYKLIFFSAALLAVIGIYARFNKNLILQYFCLPAGIVHTLLFAYPYYKTHNTPAFFHTQSNLTKLFSSPDVVRTEVETGNSSIANVLLGFVCLQPVLFPVENIFLWLVVPNIVLLVLTSYGEEIDPITNRVLLLAALANSVVATGIANIAIHSQRSAFVQQQNDVLSLINLGPIGPPEVQLKALNSYVSLVTTSTGAISLINVLILLIVFSAGKSIFMNSLGPQSIATSPPVIGDNTYIRYGISIVLLLNIILFAVFPVSNYLNNPIGPNLSMADFIIYYTPGLFILVSWSVFLVYSIGYRRWKLLTLRSSGTIKKAREVDLVITDLDKQRAIAADPLGKEEFILIDTKLYDSLDSQQIDVIYHHEIYHIHHEKRVHQMLSQVPLVGYVFALFLINPAKIYEREMKADEYASKKVSRRVVHKTLKKVDQKSTPRTPQANRKQIVGRWVQFMKILCEVPLTSLYRPSIEHRIARLQEASEKDCKMTE